jgi:hypothetical protein
MKGKYWEAFYYVISNALDPAIPLISNSETPLIYLSSSVDRNEIILCCLWYFALNIHCSAQRCLSYANSRTGTFLKSILIKKLDASKVQSTFHFPQLFEE